MADRIPRDVARRIRVVILDVDGVLTDNAVYLGSGPGDARIELKRFDIMDGLGIKMLQWAGLHVVLVSGRESAATTVRAAELGVECRQVAAGYKIPVVRAIMEEARAEWDEVAMVGDDLADLPVMAHVGLAVAVPDAAPEIRAESAWVTRRPGGRGAVRDFAEAFLQARGQWADLVRAYRLSREEGGDVEDYVERG